MALEISQTANVDGPDVFDQDSRRVSSDLDFGSKRSRSCTRRCRSNQNHRARQKCIGLHDNAEASSVLFVAHALRHTQSEDVTAEHGGPP